MGNRSKFGFLYPWIINIAEDPEPGFIGSLQKLFVNFSLWWSLPILLLLFAFFFIKKHDPVFSYIVGIIPFIGVIVISLIWSQIGFKQSRRFIRNNIGKIVLVLLVISFEIYLFSYYIPNSFEGKAYQYIFVEKNKFPWWWGASVDLSYQNLITKKDLEYETIYWVNLKEARLEGANLSNSVLERADLTKAHLKGALLTWKIHEKGCFPS